MRAVGTWAAVGAAGLPTEEAAPGLAKFTGAGRRFEEHGRTPGGALVFDDANEEVFDAVDSSDPVLLRLYPNKVTLPLFKWQGLFWVDTTLTVGNDVITGTVNFAAADAITKSTS